MQCFSDQQHFTILGNFLYAEIKSNEYFESSIHNLLVAILYKMVEHLN